jgi:MFS family permease
MNANFMLYLIGIFISGLGSKLTTIALVDKIYALTGSGAYVTLTYLLQGLPALFFGLFAGHLVDRSSKKVMFFSVNIGLAILSLALAFVSSPLFLFMLVLFVGILDAFYSPTSTALLPLLVNHKQITAANGLKVSVIGFNMIIGYAVAGLFVGFLGHTLPFLVDSCSYLFIALSALFFKLRKQEQTAAHTENRAALAEGLNFIRKHPVIRRLFMIDLLTQLIIALQIPLTYVFVAKYLGGAEIMASRTGILFSASGVGLMLGGMFIRRFAKGDKLRLLSRALICDSLFVIVFSLNRYFPAEVLLFGAMGIIGAFMGSLLETAVQENTPESLIGRVSGFIHSIADPISVFSLMIGSLLVQFIDVQHIFMLCALAELLTGAYFTLRKKVTYSSGK